IGSAELSTSQAPFVDAINVVFGENLSKIISVITSLVCIGTLNAWILTSAQISLGLAKGGFLPEFFAKRNADGAPYISVLISSFGMVPFLILTKNENLSSQIVYIIDFSVKSFLLVYLTCSLAYLKFAILQKKTLKILLSISAILFCVLMICESSWQSILIATLFTVSGIFVMPFVNKPNQTKV
ncbi:MAG: amino acid permease, partial [Alphaproteobacteria bacterium]|nr:amino acid permease [Alphaproteobacteria bacterium]